MKRQRGTIITVTLGLLWLAAASPAQAGSLLSGYGGPGEGNQAILGATLIGGPSGGGGGGGSSTGVAAVAGGSGGAALASAPAGRAPSAGTSGTPQRARGGGTSARAPRSRHSTTAPAPQARTSAPALALSAADSRTLGISQTDVVYIILAIGGLLAAGFLTRRMATPPHDPR